MYMQTQTNSMNTLPDWKADFDKWIEQGTAKSTRRAYDRDINYFFTWLNESNWGKNTDSSNISSICVLTPVNSLFQE